MGEDASSSNHPEDVLTEDASSKGLAPFTGAAMVVCLIGFGGLLVMGLLNDGIVAIDTPSFYVFCAIMLLGMFSLAYGLARTEHREHGAEGVVWLIGSTVGFVILGVLFRIFWG